jgi:hypothetical protein
LNQEIDLKVTVPLQLSNGFFGTGRAFCQLPLSPPVKVKEQMFCYEKIKFYFYCTEEITGNKRIGLMILLNDQTNN